MILTVTAYICTAHKVVVWYIMCMWRSCVGSYGLMLHHIHIRYTAWYIHKKILRFDHILYTTIHSYIHNKFVMICIPTYTYSHTHDFMYVFMLIRAEPITSNLLNTIYSALCNDKQQLRCHLCCTLDCSPD